MFKRVGCREKIDERFELTQPDHSRLQDVRRFKPVVRVMFRKALSSGWRQDHRDPMPQQDKQNVMDIPLDLDNVVKYSIALGLMKKSLGLVFHPKVLGQRHPPISLRLRSLRVSHRGC